MARHNGDNWLVMDTIYHHQEWKHNRGPPAPVSPVINFWRTFFGGSHNSHVYI